MGEEYYDTSTNRISPVESKASLFGSVEMHLTESPAALYRARKASQLYDYVSHYPRHLLFVYPMFIAYAETAMAKEIIPGLLVLCVGSPEASRMASGM